MSATTSRLQVRIFDGNRQRFAAPADFLITIFDGNQKQIHRDFHKENVLDFDCPFYDNLGDLYSVTAWCDGHRQAGFLPVKLSNEAPTTLDIMLVADDPGFSFVDARWASVLARFAFLGSDTDAATAQARYENLMEDTPKVIACFLNLAAAMGQIFLANGTPLDYIKEIRWDRAPLQDRFFAYCDSALVGQVRNAASKGLFTRETGSAVFHPGSTNSWKQVQFGEANVQLTFHENAPDHKKINGVDCVTLEPDIDYFRDPGAHAILEVAANALTHTLTDPVQVYILRWIAGQHAGVPQFEPLFTLTDVTTGVNAVTAPRPVVRAKKPKLKRRLSGRLS
jgi:hypothetical protein